MLTTNQKGAIAETAIAHAAIELGIQVLKPWVEDRYDLVFDLPDRFVRVQCKTAVRRGDVLVMVLLLAAIGGGLREARLSFRRNRCHRCVCT